MPAIDQLISDLLKKRGLSGPQAITDFFDPAPPNSFSLSAVGLDPAAVSAAVDLIRHHLDLNHPVAVYGDYDVDGLTATAILWETLYRHSKSVFPHIPHRREEGYGLSQKGIDHCLAKGAKLIITVDNGIVADSEVAYCRSRGCDIIIIDHHQPSDALPPANVILHSSSTTAAGLVWFFCRELHKTSPPFRLNEGPGVSSLESQLELVALSVVCDLVPLLGLNRSLVKFGLVELNRTSRPGLLALFEQSGLKQFNNEVVEPLNSYHVGFIVGPRLNATGRLDHAVDSLRLLCTSNPRQARELAARLSQVNSERQDKTLTSSNHAISQFANTSLPKLLIAASPDYDEGVIGLVAAKLVEAYHRPAIAVSIGKDFSKGSARSLPGFHITDHLRLFPELLSAVGGHAMAAGFTLPTPNLADFSTRATAHAEKTIPEEILVRNIKIDAEIPLNLISSHLHLQLQRFEPFGLGNPKPVFRSSSIGVSGFRRIGADNRHLKFQADNLEAIYFSAPRGVESGMTIADIVYSLDLSKFNGRETMQLVVKKLEHGQVTS